MIEPDEPLLERLRQGDNAAFETLFLRHYSPVYGVLYRLVGRREPAEDLAQETFLELYRKPPRLARGAPLVAWLCRVALNRGYNALRGERREMERLERAYQPEWEGATDSLERSEERHRVRAILAKLPERQRETLLLRHAGLSYAEVAAALGVAPGSVGTLLARAERAFLEAYQHDMEGEASGSPERSQYDTVS